MNGVRRDKSCFFCRKGYEEFGEICKTRVNETVAQGIISGEEISSWYGGSKTLTGHFEVLLEHGRKYYKRGNDDGFTYISKKSGITLEKHDELTKAGNGAGYFRLNGKISCPPKLFLAMMSDNRQLGFLDETIVCYKDIAWFDRAKMNGVINGDSRLTYWTAAPGFPFKKRDGCDLTGWHKDEDGTYWQFAYSLPGFNLTKKHPQAIRAVTNYWVYRLKPESTENGSNQYDLTLLCQAQLKGWMPTFFVNKLVPKVLAVYVRKAESVCLNMIEQDEADTESFVESFNFL